MTIKQHVTELALTTGALAAGMSAVDAVAERWLYLDAEPTEAELAAIDAEAAAVFVLTEAELAAIDASVDAMAEDYAEFSNFLDAMVDADLDADLDA
jgi:hypothetical protein